MPRIVMHNTNLAQADVVTPLPLPAVRRGPVSSLVPLIGESAWAQSARSWLAAHAHARVIGVVGDVGTGKTLLARHWHHQHAPSDAPCEVIDLRGFPAEVIETELFGYVASGFFSRHEVVPGRVTLAGSGTCIIQGFETLPAATQERCLPWLLEGTVHPVRSDESIRSVARVVLEIRARGWSAQKRGATFIRPVADLLESAVCDMEPLQKRRDDIVPLAEYYLQRYAEEWGWPRARFSHEVIRVFKRASWQENVRGLVVAVASAVHEAQGGEILVKHLPPGLLGRPAAVATTGMDAIALEDLVTEKLSRFFAKLGRYDVQDLYETVIEKVERPLLRLVLTHVDGNQVRAARLLGINRNTLRTRLKKLGVKPPRK